MGIPLVALMGRPPQIRDWGEQQNLNLQNQHLAGVNALQPGQLQEQQGNLQLQQQAIEAQKRQMETQKALDDAYKNSVEPDENGQPRIDTNKLAEALRLSGHGSAIPGILDGVTKSQAALIDLKSKAQKLQEDQADLLGHMGYAIQQAKYDPRLAHRMLDPLGDSPQIQQMRQLIDSNPDQFKQMVDSAVAQSPAQQKFLNEQEVARIRASVQKEGELPLGDKVPQLNQGLARRFQVLNPGKALPAEYTLPANATQKDFDRVDKLLTQTESAQGTKAQQDIANQTRQQTLALSQQARADTRSDKSYQFAAGQLDKTAKPIEDAVARFGRLQDTINQKTPQADALVAPELLTVMAGGQGSGLRMNEAELERMVHGRSNLESLKAALNKWSLDPSKALSITDAQRGQIRDLMNEVHGKLLAKQEIIDSARQQLVNAPGPNDHRQIITDTHKKLTTIDTSGGQSAAKKTGAPAGATHIVPGPDGKRHYTNAQGTVDLGIVP